MKRAALALLALASFAQAGPPYHSWPPTPPLGWNSWDCFATTVTEAQAKANADVMAAKLASHGWKYIVVDIQWYEPEANDFAYRAGARLAMDQYGRLLPASNRFPSGFKGLSDYVHARGLKFGIHIMRGIPRQAVAQNVAIKGTPYHAADIADTHNTCPWNSDMYGVDMSKPGAQEYYDSVYQLLASWGIDFVKVDDLSRPYHEPEIEAIRNAIDRTGRPIVLSTSPGATPLDKGAHVETHANMWRICDDFWDDWKPLQAEFKLLDNWTPFRGPGHYPDPDMLPLGAVRQVGKGPPHTRFTPDEQRLMVTLWAISGSPLIMGGDLTKLDDFTCSLLANDEVIAVDQSATGNRQLFNRDGGLIGWIADVPGSKDRYLALFNTTGATVPVPMKIAEAGFTGPVSIRDLWNKSAVTVSDQFAPSLPSHGAALYRLHGEQK